MEIKEFRVIPLSTFPLKSQAAATGTLSMAERSYPTSEVRGRSQKDPMPEGRRPRGVTPRPRSGQLPRVPGCDGAWMAERSYSVSEVGVGGGGREELPRVRGWGGDQRSYPTSEVRVVAGRSYPTPPCLKPGAAAKRSSPTSKEPWLRECRRA